MNEDWLENDELWTVRTTAGPSPGDSPSQLRRLDATGQFVPDLEAALQSDPRLVVLAARALLDANFPEAWATARPRRRPSVKGRSPRACTS